MGGSQTPAKKSALSVAAGCPVKGCPTTSGAWAFHTRRYPRGFRELDRLIRQRPHTERDILRRMAGAQ